MGRSFPGRERAISNDAMLRHQPDRIYILGSHYSLTDEIPFA
jgi:hypothetical protein